ncbi:hypothetical protein FJZ17_01025 [Candidatus Pacearchaeota archaeon]|nr:hypothetical protein [Candidatus Pacearchaeota archaeon]
MIENISRRAFFRKAVSHVATKGSGALLIYGMKESIDDLSLYKEVDEGQVITSQENVPSRNIVERTVDIEDLKLRLIGVVHAPQFARRHFNELERLVRESSHVVVESAKPVAWKDGNIVENPEEMKNSYFQTIYHLARKYGKPLITLDAVKTSLHLIDLFTWVAGAMNFRENAVKLREDKITRREALIHGLKSLGWGALAFGSTGAGGFLRSGIANLISPKQELSQIEFERFGYNHIVDQRNVQIAERLLQLPGLLNKDEVAQGKYVMVTFGAAHIPGAHYYLTHPIARKLKNALYAPTYNLLDTEGIFQYNPLESWGWRVKKLA